MIIRKTIRCQKSMAIIKEISICNDIYYIVCRGQIRLINKVEKKKDELSGLKLRLKKYVFTCKDYPLFVISWSKYEYRVYISTSNPYIFLIKGDNIESICLSK